MQDQLLVRRRYAAGERLRLSAGLRAHVRRWAAREHEVTNRLLAAIAREVPEYAVMRNTAHAEQLRRHCNMALLTWYHALLSGQSFAVVDLRQVARMGADKYRIGASVGSLMQAIRVGAAVCWNDLVALGRDEPRLAAEVLHEVSGFFLYHFDLMSEAVLRGYQAEQSADLRRRAGGAGPRLDDQAHIGQPLSRREFDVLQLLRKGLSNKQIACAIHVAEDTVKYHLRNIYGKLGVHRRAEAIANAHRAGL